MTIVTTSILKLITSKLGIFLSLILAFFAPIQILFHLMVALVIVDLITAIPKHWKKRNINGFINRCKSISSRGLRSTAIKLFIYILFIGVVYFFSIAIFKHDIYAANVAAGLIGLTELRSIGENMDIVTGNNIFTSIIKRITKQFESKITEITSKPEEL